MVHDRREMEPIVSNNNFITALSIGVALVVFQSAGKGQYQETYYRD